MDPLKPAHPFDAPWLLGDNIYPAGDPSEVRELIFHPFAGVLDGNIKLLTVRRNYDDYYNVDQQATALGC